MNVTELKSEGLKKVFKVVVPAAEFGKTVDEKLKGIAKTVKMQGFRAGKAPLAMVKQKYEASVKGEALEDLVQKTAQQVVKEQNLSLIHI